MRADAGELRTQVREVYSRAAEQPRQKHPFPVGRKFASSVGYPDELLATLPSAAADSFCGTSNVSVFARYPAGATVLDLGCGGGLDCLVASQRVGPNGRVIGVDFSESMLNRARASLGEAGVENVDIRMAEAEALPVEDQSIDVALVNGIFNLNPRRGEIFRELARVVRPGGEVYGAEIILRKLASPVRSVIRFLTGGRGNEDWFA